MLRSTRLRKLALSPVRAANSSRLRPSSLRRSRTRSPSGSGISPLVRPVLRGVRRLVDIGVSVHPAQGHVNHFLSIDLNF